MSVAFVREESAETAAEVTLPDRHVSPHPNLVTPAGLDALHRAMDEARASYEASQKIEDLNERPRMAAPALRDLRYFSNRLQTAKVVTPSTTGDVVAFGSQVTFIRDDGRRQIFRIVGEDEADARSGSISYVSPVARALIGKVVGEVISVGGHDIEIIDIQT
jgi:transcription elongation GreA/GreB family factor